VLARSLVMFLAFLPFFALRETARAVGEHRLEDLFLRPRASEECNASSHGNKETRGELLPRLGNLPRDGRHPPGRRLAGPLWFPFVICPHLRSPLLLQAAATTCSWGQRSIILG
jgi:hypothetical protein